MTTALVAFVPALLLGGSYVLLLSHVRRDDVRVRTLLVVVLVLLWVRYACWRIYSVASTFERSGEWALSFAFLVVELGAIVLACRAQSVLRFTSCRSAEATASLNWWHGQAQPPLIDVLIPTYNEAQPILFRTIAGALALDYPRYRVWILDDGKREWVRELAERHNVNYLRRPTNEHYKAGNLNHALRMLAASSERPDYVAVFDADFIARPGFLRRTLALMRAPEVALVQTPQYFYNPDPFQYALRAARVLPDDQRNWFDFRLPSLDAVGAATCCGTSCLIRMNALERVGFFPTESVSEDTLLSIKLRQAGHQTIYLNEVLSIGLAPEGLPEFLTQRVRWAMGGLQIAMHPRFGPRSHPNAAIGFGLLVESFMRWGYFSFVRILWLSIVPATLLFNVGVFRADFAEFCGYITPVFVARFSMTWLNRGTFLYIVSDAAQLILAPSAIRATLHAGFRPAAAFSVTRKGVLRDRYVFHGRDAALPLILLAATLLGLFYAWASPHSALNATGGSSLIFVWALINVLTLVATLAPCIEPPRYRGSERFACQQDIELRAEGCLTKATLIDLSESGCQLTLKGRSIGERIAVHLPSVGWINAIVRRKIGELRCGLAFEVDETEQMALIRHVYGSETVIRRIDDWSFLRSMSALMRYFVRA
jgi:cellulose synthase (UDP-forming)